MNLIAAKAKKCILNISPAGCGKTGTELSPFFSFLHLGSPSCPTESAATNTTHQMLDERAQKFSSLTLAGLKHLKDEFTAFAGHIIIDDLGGEKREHWGMQPCNPRSEASPQGLSQSEWSRVSTITVLANLCHTHYVKKITQSYVIEIIGFYGSAALNIQPIMMSSLVQSDDWIAVIRDKVLRYYHLIRPLKPRQYIPEQTISWGVKLSQVELPKKKGKLWYQLVAVGLTQWSYARCLEHIPQLLKACAALDNRTKTNTSDYTLLYKLMKPMQLERYLVKSYGFETNRVFQNDTLCLLVELASHGNPTIETICEDYKVSPKQ